MNNSLPPGFEIHEDTNYEEEVVYCLFGPCDCGSGSEYYGEFAHRHEAAKVANLIWCNPKIHDKLLESLRHMGVNTNE